MGILETHGLSVMKTERSCRGMIREQQGKEARLFLESQRPWLNSGDKKEGDILQEIWKDVEGFEGLYQVSIWGRIRSVNGILKPYKNKKGYLKIGLYKDGKCYKKRVSRLIANTFIPNPYGLPEVNHIDGNKENNSISNLEWVDGETNRKHYAVLRERFPGDEK